MKVDKNHGLKLDNESIIMRVNKNHELKLNDDKSTNSSEKKIINDLQKSDTNYISNDEQETQLLEKRVKLFLGFIAVLFFSGLIAEKFIQYVIHHIVN